MWFLGLVIGGLLGGAVGNLIRWDEAWLLFAALGAVAGIVYRSKTVRSAAPARVQALEQRIAALEHDVWVLKQQPHGAGAPAQASAPAAAPATPQEQPSAPASMAAAVLANEAAAPLPAAGAAPAAEAAIPEAKPAPKAPAEPSWLWQKLFGGNILAKVGVVMLLFGVGSGLKLAIDFGMFPPSVRLLIATVAGLGMIAFGYTRMRSSEHRMFGLAVQGGGFGVLYLVTYFALARYGYIQPSLAFALFAALGLACMVTALRFEGEPLAILGVSGAFLAPLLASTGSGNYIVLFSYFAVLDVMVLGVNVLRAWRVLTLVSLVFTFVTGMSWAARYFTPAAFPHTEAFLALFFAIFSLAPVLTAVLKREAREHWADSLLLFGTPIAAAVAQNWLIGHMGYENVVLAWSAVGAGIYYSVLAAALFMREAPESVRLAHSAIAVALYTIAVPLAFGVQVTSAFWAIEGLALAWFGATRQRALPYAAGMILQLVAGAYFQAHWQEPRAMPVLNGFYVGCMIMAGCGASTAWITKRHAGQWLGTHPGVAFPLIAGAWALVWWLAANFSEISQFAPKHHQVALDLGVLIVTAWVLMAIGKALPATITRYVALLLGAFAALGGLLDGWGLYGNHPLHDSMVFALPAAFVTLYAILRTNERDGLRWALPAAHVYALLMLTSVLLRETLWVAVQVAPGVGLWRVLAWMVVPAASTYVLVHFDRHGVWPLTTQRRAYLAVGAPVLLVVAVLAALAANFNHAGGGFGLPYLPVASFFDAAQIAVIFAVLAWTGAMQPRLRSDGVELARNAAAALGFIWLSAMAMRLAHHWGGVAFRTDALLASGMAQSLLSLLWTAIALTLMISATRKVMRQRWFLGFALLGVVGAKFVLVDVVNKGTVTWTLSLIGVGLLILAASYFSPAPPRAASATPAP